MTFCRMVFYFTFFKRRAQLTSPGSRRMGDQHIKLSQLYFSLKEQQFPVNSLSPGYLKEGLPYWNNSGRGFIQSLFDKAFSSIPSAHILAMAKAEMHLSQVSPPSALCPLMFFLNFLAVTWLSAAMWWNQYVIDLGSLVFRHKTSWEHLVLFSGTGASGENETNTCKHTPKNRNSRVERLLSCLGRWEGRELAQRQAVA